MQIVIDIPDGAYEELCSARFPVQDAYRLVRWIVDGIPLPADWQQSAKTGWIPCSERLPEDGDTYLVSGYEMWEGKKLPFVDCATYPGSYIDGWDTYGDWDEGQDVHIIAWQEMPEAWEDEE